jgi:hypothetical protein
MKKEIEKMNKLNKDNPEKAKEEALDFLNKIGISDKEGNLIPPYNGEKVNDEDFTMGPQIIKKNR